ncbi:HAMP domain-containing sensor histidine kinase [Streptomyces dubilierae]|uniref:histidine kinase n=1 Tax=Streptomyces dubilierae TaxID=3075533 RepID=A0ABU2P422_9ACTN|nr:HAMP domain-containing sensor histidine kinase [Streptomyces sp. DSM 41921]MDT0386892.1 HAMP domain-containing sensor histidine kinase [Streptomyces sp. DSM 41921]
MRAVLPRWSGTLAVKAAVFITVMCCALAALLGVLVHVQVTNQTVDQAREQALQRLAQATERYEAGDALRRGAGVDPPGLPGSLRELAVAGDRGTMVADREGRPVMWAAGPVDGGRALAVAVDYGQQARTIDGLDRAILWSSGLAIGATLLVGSFAVTRVTRRLHTTALVARRISAGDLDARVNDPRTRPRPEPRDRAHPDDRTHPENPARAKDPRRPKNPAGAMDPRRWKKNPVRTNDPARATDPPKDPPRPRVSARPQDEVAAVAAALDSMAASLQGKLLAEQRFTADVAHELRTPLTGLHAAAELLPPGRPTELVRDRVAALRTLTEDLLEISRLDTGRERLELDTERLGPLAERVVRASGSGTRVVVVRDVAVETDRRRLERVLGNLVANAHKHGRGPVVLTVDGPVVTVRDHGDGFPEYLVAHGPQRFRTEGGARGHGLGLTIALGQAEVLGARLEFANAPDGGAVATLELPVD